MIETLTSITLSVLFLIFFRPGKTPPLNNSLVIERPGKYHITLMPLLNLAQPFIETVAGQIGSSGETARDSTTQCFEVRDNQVAAHGYGCYLFAITQRNGILYFHAASPQSSDPGSYLRTISEYANAKLVRFPTTGGHDSALDERIVLATKKIAHLRSVHIKLLGYA